MPKRLTYEYVKNYIEIESDSGCKLLSTGYISGDKKLNLQCNCGNEFKTSFSSFKYCNQRKCKRCNNFLDYELVKYFIEVESGSGCKLLSDKYTKYEDKLELQCHCGDNFYVSFSNFKTKNQRQCKKCNNIERLSYEDVKKYIEIESNSGCKLLSTKYKGCMEKLKLQCKCGNEFETDFRYIKSRNKLHCNECSNISRRNKHRYTNLQVNDILNSKGYSLVSKEYSNVNSSIIIKDNDEYFYNIYLLNLIKNNTCSKFHKGNPFTIQNIKNWCKINNKNFILLSDKYENAHKDLKWRCLEDGCNNDFNANLNSILRGRGCPYCAGKRASILNCVATKLPNVALEWHPTLNKNLTPYDFTYGSGKKVWFLCPECGNVWLSSIDNRRDGHGCPACAESKLEKQISVYFDENRISCESQVKFDNLIGLGGGLLSYDFRLKDYNILIEAQGQQHEYPVDFTGEGMEIAQQNFEKQLIHDRRKRDYAQQHGIRFLEIWYYDIDKISEILDKELNINNQALFEKSEGVFNCEERGYIFDN